MEKLNGIKHLELSTNLAMAVGHWTLAIILGA